jgi:hypothetical protein
MRDLNELNKYRDHSAEKQILGDEYSEKHYSYFGVFNIPTKGVRKGLKVIVSSAEAGDLVLHPLAPNRGEALLQALSAFDDEFLHVLHQVVIH